MPSALAGGLDEEFDMLGSRSKSPGGGATSGGIDLLAGKYTAAAVGYMELTAPQIFLQLAMLKLCRECKKNPSCVSANTKVLRVQMSYTC